MAELAYQQALPIANLITEACVWFSKPNHVFLGDPRAPRFSDAEVVEICNGAQRMISQESRTRTSGGQCTSHANGRHKGVFHTRTYFLNELPMARRRNLAERVYMYATKHGLLPLPAAA